MILRTSPQQQHSFTEEFQKLSGWADLSAMQKPEYALLFQTVSDESFPGAVLPRLVSNEVVYYALADTRKDWRSLSPMLKAFVGLTVTNFVGLGSVMDMDDPLEAWLASRQFSMIARFGAGADRIRSEIARSGLGRLYECYRTSSRPQRARPQSTRQALDDLQMALVARDWQESDRIIDFLRANMRLDAMNMLFLEVRIEESFGEWNRLCQQSFFKDLCYTRRPPNVTSAMVEAIYRTTIEPSESAEGPLTALEVFRARVANQYGDLFAVCPPHPRVSVAKMFLLNAISGEDVDLRVIERLEHNRILWSPDDLNSFDQFRALAEPPKPASLPRITRSWADLYDILELAKDESEPATAQRARAALVSAAALQTLDAYSVVVNYVNRLNPEDRESLLQTPGFSGIWSDICGLGGAEIVPRNWIEWIDSLPHLSYEQARTCAERAVSEWPIAQHLQHPTDVDALVDALSKSYDSGEPRLNDALPYLLEWIQSDDRWPNPELMPLYERLLLLLLLSDRRTLNTLQALAFLVDGMLSLGLSKSAYVSLLTDLKDLVRQLDGILYIDWLLDIAELISLYSCSDVEVRQAFWVQILATAGRFSAKLSTAQLRVLNELMGILGLPEGFVSLTPSTVGTERSPMAMVPRGFYVAIYTLMQGVGERLARVLTTLYPGIRVELSDDKTASQRLVSMARNADLFVICWRSAKHAATDAIRQQRPDDSPIIYASGKGSSSILAAVGDAMANLTE